MAVDLAPDVTVPDAARRLFAAYGDRARRAVVQALPSGEPAKYHYDLLPLYVLRPSKHLRPVLCMAACAAFGGRVEQAMPAAVAIELLHNAFLIHDDIQDGSVLRRGKPTLHVEYGVPIALNVGDALATLSTERLRSGYDRLRPWVHARVIQEFEDMTRETIEGQAMELGWRRDGIASVTVADYLRLALKKTSWYTTIQPIHIGAVLATNGLVTREPFVRFGSYLGAMFQVANDIASVDGGVEAATRGDDIREGKPTLLLVHLLGSIEGRDRARLLGVVSEGAGARDDDEVNWVIERMHALGSVEYARSCMRGLAGAAIEEASRLFGPLPASEDRTLLLSMTPLLLELVG